MARSTRKRKLLFLLAGLLLLCLLLAAAAAISNIFLPSGSATVDRLSAEEKAYIAESFHLRAQIGDEIWPGFAAAAIPQVVYNEQYAFLLNYPGVPPDGWRTVPRDRAVGNAWEEVPGDDFDGAPYYRTLLPAPDVTPQAFTIRVGDAWVGSLTTLDWMRIAFADELRQIIPDPLEPVLPYKLVARLFVGGPEKHISALLHETFHAYQGQVQTQELAAAERAAATYGDRYPAADVDHEALWQEELDILADAAAQAREGADANTLRALAQAFLAQRAARRETMNLSPALIAYEQHREWIEGQAKYVELQGWNLAATTPGYEPLPALAAGDDFDGYDGATKAWSREIDQIRRMAGNDGDGRFYYSGLAQAVLLDHLLPGWKAQALDEGLSLEELLATAMQ